MSQRAWGLLRFHEMGVTITTFDLILAKMPHPPPCQRSLGLGRSRRTRTAHLSLNPIAMSPFCVLIPERFRVPHTSGLWTLIASLQTALL